MSIRSQPKNVNSNSIETNQVAPVESFTKYIHIIFVCLFVCLFVFLFFFCQCNCKQIITLLFVPQIINKCMEKDSVAFLPLGCE